MRKLILIIIFTLCLTQTVSAAEITAPAVPESGQAYMPDSTDSFGEGLWHVIRSAVMAAKPSIAKAAGLCVSVIAVVLIISLLQTFTSRTRQMTEIAAAVGIGIILLNPINTLINLGVSTVNDLFEYGKLLIAVMTTAVAAQGSVSTSTALYTGTMLFTTLLSAMISRLVVPMLYVYLCLSILNSAVGEDILKKLSNFIKWLITWSLKCVLYIFTGYISITGVVGGSADASMVKATKLAISGSVPVIGNILSDASETILVSAGVVKSAAGVYGVLAIAAIWIGPFLEVGIQYLLLKLTAGICGLFGAKRIVTLVQEFSTAMGFVVAMICTISVLLLIGVVCYMKGAST